MPVRCVTVLGLVGGPPRAAAGDAALIQRGAAAFFHYSILPSKHSRLDKSPVPVAAPRVLRYTSRVARLLHTAVSGDGLYKAVLEPKFDLTLARMASERSLRTFVVWPPVVRLQRDDDDTPTDGYGGNSSRFIEAYLGMDER